MNLKKKMIPALTATLMACASFVSADSDNTMTMVQPPEGGLMGTNDYNAPSAREYWQDTDGKLHVATGPIFDAELLVWQAHADYSEVAVLNSPIAATGSLNGAQGPFTNAKSEHLSFKWDAGVRLGLGYIFEHDSWDLYGAWTHFHGKASKNVNNATSTGTQTLYPTWSSAAMGSAATNLTATAVNSNWKLKMDLLDLELGREFFAGKMLSVRPHFGLRGGWIYQDYNVAYYGVANSTTAVGSAADEIEMQNNFKGIGVRAGLDTEWNIGCSFALFGDAAASILYGRYDVTQAETSGPNNQFATVASVLLNTSDAFNDSKAITDLALGIRWVPDLTCWCSSIRFILSASWEHHMFFNQSQLKRMTTFGTATTPTSGTNQTIYSKEGGDLSTQGVTISARLEF